MSEPPAEAREDGSENMATASLVSPSSTSQALPIMSPPQQQNQPPPEGDSNGQSERLPSIHSLLNSDPAPASTENPRPEAPANGSPRNTAHAHPYPPRSQHQLRPMEPSPPQPPTYTSSAPYNTSPYQAQMQPVPVSQHYPSPTLAQAHPYYTPTRPPPHPSMIDPALTGGAPMNLDPALQQPSQQSAASAPAQQQALQALDPQLGGVAQAQALLQASNPPRGPPPPLSVVQYPLPNTIPTTSAPLQNIPPLSTVTAGAPLPPVSAPMSLPLTHNIAAAGPMPATPTSTYSSTGSDRYTCDICKKSFSRPSSLRIHTHSHTGEKPYTCSKPGCGKSFSVRSNMKRHERGCHAGEGSSIAGPGINFASPRSAQGRGGQTLAGDDGSMDGVEEMDEDVDEIEQQRVKIEPSAARSKRARS